MVFNFGQDLYFVLFTVLTIWLAVLSFFLYRATAHYDHLTKGVAKEDLRAVLEKVLTQINLSEEKIDELTKHCHNLEAEDHFHLKKIGVLRFNPFKDTGGNQSFVLALLSEEDSGLILSSLYTRTGSRWYVKQVKNGKGVELELSKEEQEAIRKARV